mmetsp:Transcript_68801/g.188835  ORF Transcript_68801/g.188835 Transcript_68801/m.188835 type:complete len:121 (+) Transcript_68801:118-480(+)
MKFGKRFKAAQRAGWVYLDYKGLKQLVKRLASSSASSSSSRGSGSSSSMLAHDDAAQQNQFLEEVAFCSTHFVARRRRRPPLPQFPLPYTTAPRCCVTAKPARHDGERAGRLHTPPEMRL